MISDVDKVKDKWVQDFRTLLNPVDGIHDFNDNFLESKRQEKHEMECQMGNESENTELNEENIRRT